MHEDDKIFSSALEQLSQGKTLEEVLLLFPEHQEQLKPLLEIANELLTLPKNEVPAPAMRRKYILEPSPVFWLSWLGLSRWATASLSLVLVFSAIAGTSYATIKSQPGQVFFQVKRLAEQTRVSLATDPATKAQRQVEIAQRRLQDAEAILQNPASNTQQETAALDELVATTNSTIDAVSAAAHSNSFTDKNHPIVASLENITTKQQALLKQAKQKPQNPQIASSVLQTAEASTDKVANIKRYLEIASNEQTLTKVLPDPNAVTISGFITHVDKTSITVEKTKFTVNINTVIKDAVGNSIEANNLNSDLKVTVVGTKDNDIIAAQQISVIAQDPVGKVEGATSTNETASSTPKTQSTTTSSSIHKSTEVKKEPTGDSPTSTDPNLATGSFILESPSSQ